MIQQIPSVKERLQNTRPLIHSITSPIAINDCANAVLALGAQPIMAEHPQEVAGITATARALVVSLANITDVRIRSMHISGNQARESGIPSLIDLVGVTCSPLRMEQAKRFIEESKPAVVKGNYSEIRAMAGAVVSSTSGIDTAEEDIIRTAEDRKLEQMRQLVHDYAAEHHTVVLATGVIDLISDGRTDLCITNGHELMSRVTGTGCILSCIAGTYLAAADPLEACLCAVLNWDIAGERAAELAAGRGLGSYHVALMDALSTLTGEELIAAARVEV